MFSIKSLVPAHFRQLVTGLVNKLPSCCPICRLPQSNSLLCRYCRESLYTPEFSCFQCAEPLPADLMSRINHSREAQKKIQNRITCGRCQNFPPAFDQVIARLSYRPPLSKLIQDYKFSNNLFLLPSLIDCLQQQLLSNLKQGYELPDAVIAIPLHPKRIKQRGYNQADLLAKAIARRFELTYFSKHVRRLKFTNEQTRLNRKQRQHNIKNAFEICSPLEINGQTINKIAVVDDVITSGSTSNELARSLKQAGVTIVDIWCLAKTPFIK